MAPTRSLSKRCLLTVKPYGESICAHPFAPAFTFRSVGSGFLRTLNSAGRDAVRERTSTMARKMIRLLTAPSRPEVIFERQAPGLRSAGKIYQEVFCAAKMAKTVFSSFSCFSSQIATNSPTETSSFSPFNNFGAGPRRSVGEARTWKKTVPTHSCVGP